MDFSEHYLASYLAERGFGFLGWNTRFRGNEANFLLDHALAEIGVGVRWLREQAGAEQIVLLGNSGGGSLMAAYQSQAVEPNVAPVTGMRPLARAREPARRRPLHRARRALGPAEVLTAWLDPSVTDETRPAVGRPGTRPLRSRNGPPFSPEFQARYRAAQRARNERITDWALAGLDALAGTRARDRLFSSVAHLGGSADDRPVDRAVRPPAELVLPRRPGEGQLRRLRHRHGSTLRTWLSMWSLRTSQCIAAPHLARITVPSLVVHATADACVYESDARALMTRSPPPTRRWSSSRPITICRSPTGRGPRPRT